MSEQQFVVYRVASRQLKQVVAIPWAEPAPPVIVPYPAYLEAKFIRRNELGRKFKVNPELNVYPITPVDSSAFLPAWLRKDANKTSFDITRQNNPQLDEFPFVVTVDATNIPPAWEQPKANKSAFDLTKQDLPQLDVYPQTVPVDATNLPTAWMAKAANQIRFEQTRQDLPALDEYPSVDPFAASGFYPGSARAESFKIWFKRDLKQPLEFNDWPATPPVPEQPLTAFMAPVMFRRHQARQMVRILHLDEYPEGGIRVVRGYRSIIELDRGYRSKAELRRGYRSKLS